MGAKNVSGTDEELLPIHNRIIVNSHTLDDKEFAKGCGLYLGCSQFDHSCHPNADFFLRYGSTTLRVVALTDIPDIQSVRLRYCDFFEPTHVRRNLIMKHYYFHCTCSVCEDTERDDLFRSVPCAQSKCGGPVALRASSKKADGACQKCGTAKAVSTELVSRSRDAAAEVLEVVERSEAFLATNNTDQGQKVALRCLKELYQTSIAHTLHPLNYAYIKFVQHFYNHFVINTDPEDVELHIMWLKDYVEAYRFYDPAAVNFGVRLAALAEYLALHDRFKEAEEYFHQAEPILRLFFGSSHFLYKSMVMSKEVMQQFKFLRHCKELQF